MADQVAVHVLGVIARHGWSPSGPQPEALDTLHGVLNDLGLPPEADGFSREYWVSRFDTIARTGGRPSMPQNFVVDVEMRAWSLSGDYRSASADWDRVPSTAH